MTPGSSRRCSKQWLHPWQTRVQHHPHPHPSPCPIPHQPCAVLAIPPPRTARVQAHPCPPLHADPCPTPHQSQLAEALPPPRSERRGIRPTAAATRPAGRISTSKAMHGKLIVHSQHPDSGSVVVMAGPDKLCLVTALHLGCPLHKVLQCIIRKHIQICTTRCTAVACDVANMG